MKISFPILFFNAIFVFLFNLPLTVIAPFFLTFGIEKSYKENNYDKLKKQINKFPIITTILIAIQGFMYCLLIGIAGYFKYPDKYTSFLDIFAFIITISYSYQIIPSYFNYLLISDLMIKMRVFLFKEKGLIFDTENKKIWKQLLISLIIIGVLPVFSIIVNLFSNGFFTHLNSTTGGFLAELLIVFISITLTVIFVARSFTLPISNLVEATTMLQEGNIGHKTPVIVGNEIGDLTLHFNKMTEGLKDRELIKDVFGKMVDPSVRDHILHGNINLGGVLTSASVLFSDIRNFTGISENMKPEQVVSFLNNYFDRMSTTIKQGRGFVNKFIGDALMVVFGVPIEYTKHADESVMTAIRMQRELKELNRLFAEKSFPTLKAGIGIHTGELVAGNIGSSNRMEYTVIGDTVNLSSRLEGLTKLVDAAIVCSSSTLNSLSGDSNYKHRFLLKIKVKGRKQPVSVYEILDGYDENEISLRIKSSNCLEKPLSDFYNKKFNSAYEKLLSLKEIYPEDRLIDYYISQSISLKTAVLPDDWDSIE